MYADLASLVRDPLRARNGHGARLVNWYRLPAGHDQWIQGAVLVGLVRALPRATKLTVEPGGVVLTYPRGRIVLVGLPRARLRVKGQK